LFEQTSASKTTAGDGSFSLREVIHSVTAYRSLREPAFAAGAAASTKAAAGGSAGATSGEKKAATEGAERDDFHSNIFHRFFVHGEEARRDELDDLLYFVPLKKKTERDDPFFVRRRTAKDLPSAADVAINW
jgi:hypothetical protein